MKKITLLAPFLFLLSLQAEVIKPEIISGDTMKQYSKPGAPIEMKYDSLKVDLNETADVNVTLHTTVTNGTLTVQVNLDKELINLSETASETSYEIQAGQQDFLMNFQVKAEEEGLFYIKLLTKIQNSYGSKLRSFAIPVYIGEEKNKILPKGLVGNQFKALDSGENISVSKAIETIKVLK